MGESSPDACSGPGAFSRARLERAGHRRRPELAADLPEPSRVGELPMWRMIPYWLRRSEGVRLPLRGKSIMNPGISRQRTRSPRYNNAVERRGKSSPPKGEGERILVVEDDDRVRHVTMARLQSLGYRVLEASNRRAALDLLERE